MRLLSLLFYATVCFCVYDGLTINGSSTIVRTFDDKVRTFCDYFRQIENLLSRAEDSGDLSDVSWTYGYLSAVFYNRDHSLKLIIEAYMKGDMTNDHSKAMFHCLEKFTKKLSLHEYVSDVQGIDPNLKKVYLTVTEDLRSIMESGVVLSFNWYDRNEPDKLSERFLRIYKTRVSLSDPINELFALLSNRNCSLNQCFLSQVFIGGDCDSKVSRFKATISFLNSVQRYLISGLFVEDLHLTLNMEEINRFGQLQKYQDQMSAHRTQYRNISHLLTDAIKSCHTSLNKAQQDNFYNLAYRKSTMMVTLHPLLRGPILYIVVRLIFGILP